MTPEKLVTMLLAAAVSTFGFSVMFRVRKKHLLAMTIGGMLGYLFYLAADILLGNELFSNFMAALLSAVYCEICAHSLRAPVQIYLIPVLIPLFPGGMLYYAMYYLLAHDYALFSDNLILTLEASFGIAGGMIVGLAASVAVLSIVRKIKFRKTVSDGPKEDSHANR